MTITSTSVRNPLSHHQMETTKGTPAPDARRCTKGASCSVRQGTARRCHVSSSFCCACCERGTSLPAEGSVVKLTDTDWLDWGTPGSTAAHNPDANPLLIESQHVVCLDSP
jgi:hypothetical protein